MRHKNLKRYEAVIHLKDGSQVPYDQVGVTEDGYPIFGVTAPYEMDIYIFSENGRQSERRVRKLKTLENGLALYGTVFRA